MTTTLRYIGDIAHDGTTKPFRVAVRDGVHADAIQELRQASGIEIIDDPTTAQGMLIRSATKFLLESDLQRYGELMYLVRVGVGTDNIDMRLASKAGIATMNTPGASTRAVAQRALTFMLAWAARTHQGTQALSAQKWPKGDTSVEPIDLSEKTLGIVGYGRIGRETRRLAEQYFKKTIFTDAQDIDGKVDLRELLEEADVISLHIGGTEEVLTPDTMSLLKPGTLVVNTSRGEVVNAKAFAQRMNDGVYAGFDVFPVEGEKMFQDSSIVDIVRHPNFLGTPHTAASDAVTQKKLAAEGGQRMEEFATKGVINPFDIQGHTLPRIVPAAPVHPCIRGVLTHRSVPGVLAKITSIIAAQDVNVRGLINEEGVMNGGTHLAVTEFDLVEGNTDTALRIMNMIEKELQPHRKRLLHYSF